MRNAVSSGSFINYTNGTGAIIGSGTFVLVGTKIGVAIKDIAIAATEALQVVGEFTYTKNTADVVAQGGALYWDNTNKRLTTTASGNTYAGWATVAASGTDTTVSIKINN